MPEEIVDGQEFFQGPGRGIKAFVARPRPDGPERKTEKIGGRQVEVLVARLARLRPAVVVARDIWGLDDHIT